MITVAIVEDHQIFVDALKRVLALEKDLEFAGSVATFKESLAMVTSSKPDVLIVEIELPDGDGLDLVPKVKSLSPQTRIIVLTRSSDDMKLVRAVELGVKGYLSKSCSLSELLVALRKVSQGEVVMPSERLVELLRRVSQRRKVMVQGAQVWERLTPREHEVLTYLAKGKSGDVIAEELSITPLTVRTHIRNLMSKLGVHSRLEAVSYAVNNGLVDWRM
jgi:DNA-binding NarL/FixJ family response regulator